MEIIKPKPFAFVLMPFDDKFNDIYKIGIKEACEKSGSYCERVDEQIFDGSILDRIYNQIYKADIIISDMTDRNPNVFYETGYAHALGKKCILMTQNSDDIPFDLKHYPHIVYKGKIVELRDELSKRIKSYLERDSNSVYEPETELQLFSNGEKIENGSTLHVKDSLNGKDVYLQIDIFNQTSKMTARKTFELSLITKNIAKSKESIQTIKQPDGTYIHYFPDVFEIFPASWASTRFSFETGFPNNLGKEFHRLGNGVDCQLKIHSLYLNKIFDVKMMYVDPRADRI
ncbi:MAG: hypothetical protein WCS69_11855 [Ignavibacteriaceae bacterium]